METGAHVCMYEKKRSFLLLRMSQWKKSMCGPTRSTSPSFANVLLKIDVRVAQRCFDININIEREGERRKLRVIINA